MPCTGSFLGLRPPQPYTAKGGPANQPKRLRRSQSHYRKHLLLSLWQFKTAPSPQLASLPPQIPFILSPPPASPTGHQAPRLYMLCLCAATPPPRPQAHLAGFTASSVSHQRLLHTATATVPPTSFPCLQSCDGSPTIRCHNLNRGFSVLLDLAQPHLQPLALQCAILATPDSSFRTTKCSLHLHTCLFLPICTVSCFSSEADLKRPLFYSHLESPTTTYLRRYVLIPVSTLCT